MFRQAIIIFILSLLMSCSATYLITVRQDGSAIVDVDYDSTALSRYSQSDVISKIDTNIANRVTFKISNIDSLGHYLPFHPSGFFSFSKKGNALTVSDGHTDAFSINNWFCCSVYMFIKFDKDIQSFESANRLARKKDNRTILIKKSRRQLIKGKKKIDLTVKIE